MAGMLTRPARRMRPGLTLPELLAAIVLFGTMGALLLPRLLPVPAREPVRIAHEEWRRNSCPYGGGTVLPSPLWWGERGYIGAQLDLDPSSDGYVCVRGVLPGRPAHSAGLRRDDIILRVDGVSTRKRDVETVVKMITRGRPGTPVRLGIRRPGSGEIRELRAIRQSFHSVFLPGVTARSTGVYWEPHGTLQWPGR